MAMTPAEKQRAYRARMKAAVSGFAECMDIYPETSTPFHGTSLAAWYTDPAPDFTALLRAVDELYDGRATNTQWRIRLRAEIEKLKE